MRMTLLMLFTLALSGLAAETVTVTFKDGKTEKGELVKSDPDKVVLKVNTGGQNIELPLLWTRIKEVSNGLTRDAALAEWKKQNAGKLCEKCEGNRAIDCAKCAGTGKLPVPMIDCKKCNGAGTAACPAKGCEKGAVDCPNKCLRLSEGKWELGDENLRWQKFTFKGGWKSWSEKHLGEVIELVDGVPTNKGKCPKCGGATKVKCEICKGTGEAECAVCKGKKQVPAQPNPPACPDCKGVGKLMCPTCKGKGLKP